MKLLVFSGKSCPPCRRWKAEVLPKLSDVNVKVIYYEDEPELAAKMSISSVPTFIFVENDENPEEIEVKQRITGYTSEDEIRKYLT